VNPAAPVGAFVHGAAAVQPLAIVSAMHAELHALLADLEGAQALQLGGRCFHTGRLHGRNVVLVLSGIGKVAAATTATLLLQAFGATQIVFTGVAGGLGDGVQVGDVVLARQLLQHDIDASPLFPRFQVPLSGRSFFDADAALCASLRAAALRCLERRDSGFANRPGDSPPRLHEGLVVSGDRFVSSAAESTALRALLPAALAVEMEGAALAQVCHDFGTPFAVLRTISDRADDGAHVDFNRFIDAVASVYTRAIIGDWLAGLPTPRASPPHNDSAAT
jgi:adenosylhomocysteine nucleosidase